MNDSDGTSADWFTNTYGDLSGTFSEFIEICNEICGEIEDLIDEVFAILTVKVVQEPITWISPDQAQDFYCAAFNKWIDDRKKKERSPPKILLDIVLNKTAPEHDWSGGS